MTDKPRNIAMLVTLLVDGETYKAHHGYSVPGTLAALLVREKSAKFVTATARDTKSKAAWHSTLRPGDMFNWQITLELPIFIKPRISAAYETERVFPNTRRQRRYLDEVGGDGARISPAQAKAIDYLVKNEAKLYGSSARSPNTQIDVARVGTSTIASPRNG